ncbi:MAG TPA: Zn-dependent hydrolase [Clostridiales bacterium UBA8153]|nr:Zn-dependent hydrolase [Clostridiales bacterium UBA8153]
MPVSATRLEGDLQRFAAWGGTPGGGVSRIALTPADRLARRELIGLLRGEGLEVRMDEVGNIFGRLGSWERAGVLLGSHLDTVPEGGRYDGTAGVVAAVEVIRALREEGRLPPCPLGVAAFTAEESTRYGVATIGSKVMAGVMSLDAALALTDAGGLSLGRALEAQGGREWVAGPADAGEVGAFLELHVEQGRELELAGAEVGVVTHIAAPTRLKLTVFGQAGHSGSAPMGLRKDGLTAAAELILALEQLGEDEAEHGTVATATILALHPVSINVIPGQVELGIDVRSLDAVSKRRAVQRFLALAQRVCDLRGVRFSVAFLADEEPARLAPELVAAASSACTRLGVRHLVMVSRAGHDIANLSRLAPAALVFVPSRGGLSHQAGEFTSLEALVTGTRVLAETALAAAALVGEGCRHA